MILEKLKRKAVAQGVSKPKGNSAYMIILLIEDKSIFNDVDNFFSPFDVEIVDCNDDIDKLENIFNLYFKSKIYVIADSKKVDTEEKVNQLADVTKGRTGVMFIGDSSDLSSYWKMKESGFDEYTSFESDSKVPYQMILKYFGIFKGSSSHRFLITDTTQSGSDKFLNYFYDNLYDYTQKRPGLKTLIVSFDFLSVTLDAKIGKKTDSKIIDLLSGSEKIDNKLIENYLISASDNLSYFSIDLLGGDGNHTFESLVSKVNLAVNLLEADFSYIFYYIPFYMTKTSLYKTLLTSSDNLSLITDSSLESVYMLKNIIDNQVNLTPLKSKTKMLGITGNQKTDFLLDGKSIYKKLGMKFTSKYSIDGSGFNVFKKISSATIIEDMIKI